MSFLRKGYFHLNYMRISFVKWLPAVHEYPTLATTATRYICHRNILHSSPRFTKLVLPECLTFPRYFTVAKPYSTASPDPTDRGILVYEGRVNRMLKNVKIFSLSTSFFGLVSQPFLWYTVQDLSLAFAAPLFAAVNLFVFLNPILIHYCAKRYVNELYYNSRTQTFTAVLLTLFARKTCFSYTAKDVVVPDIPGVLTMLIAKGRPLFVDERDFSSIEVYKHMMGFDKPLDLRYVADNSEKKK